MVDVAVLGTGLVGSAIARDMAGRMQVRAVDRDELALRHLLDVPTVECQVHDLATPEGLKAAVEGVDYVVNATPGHMGFDVLRRLIEAGRNVVDIAFFPEDALSLDSLAKEKGITVVFDMGVAPGLDHLLLGHHDRDMQVQSFQCYVGGLPKRRVWPFQYKAPFSPVDVIEEYTRPARFKANGVMVEKPALSDPEFMEFEDIGTLEAFNTDGLRSLLTTMPHIPHMVEKTLRYPGHVDLIKALRAAGFFSEEKMTVQGRAMSPLALTSELLKRAWHLEPGDEEFTVMRVVIEGVKDGDQHSVIYDLLDDYDTEQQISSMARTTGYTCNAVVELIRNGFQEKGVFAPEMLGKKGFLPQILLYMENRGLLLTKAFEIRKAKGLQN